MDFKELKARISLEAALSHYGAKLRKSGKELRGKCPLPCGEDGGDKCFSVDPEKRGGVWKCHHKGCGADRRKQGGDLLDLVRIVESCSLRETGLKLSQWFSVGESAPRPQGKKKPALDPKAESQGATCDVAPRVPEGVINPPLGWELKRVDRDAAAEYAKGRGFSAETVERFGLSVAQGGRLAGRLAMPIHDGEGTLIGYAGRALDGGEPKYLLPSSEAHGFYKSHLLFNLHRVLTAPRRVRTVAVCEGFFDCMRLAEAGFPTVGLMGSSISDEQVKLLRAYFRFVALVLDGDAAGKQGSADALGKLGRGGYVRAVKLPEGSAPDEMTPADLREVMRY